MLATESYVSIRNMILTTHAIVGTALTHTYINYFTVFIGALASHYIFDAIPHWHYPIPYIKKHVNDISGEGSLTLHGHFFYEVWRILADIFIGIGLSFYFFGGISWATSVAALGAMLPDILVGFWGFYHWKFLNLHYRFHKWIHAKLYLDDMPIIGIGSQLLIVILFLKLFRVY